MRTVRLLTLLAASAALVGCGGSASPEEPSGPHDPAAEFSDLMVAEPSATLPGSRIELSFPDETVRGMGFVLEEEVGDGWDVRYFLTAAPAGGYPLEPSWVPAADGEPIWDSAGILGPGPDVVEVPDTATDGTYRVCTAMLLENHCTQIRVTSN